ncbi:MAG: LXG domain-containing protein, partial [Streptococcaceae bacterium]|nr:LXG domain-containing protein [Streptococcaceae bacterium]
MSNDELYYSSLTDLMVRIIGGLKNRTSPLDDLSQALNQLMSTDTIQGQAADGMKAYISEVHGNLIQVLQTALNNYEMVLSKYVSGYLQVDSNEDFKLVKQDFDAHQQKLSTHRSDFTKLGDQLKAISDEAEDIVWLGGAGGYRLNNVANEMDAMKQTVVNLQKSWDQYESDNRAVFNTVQDLISQTFSLLKQTLTIPRGYSYSVGSFRNLMSQSFLSAYQASSDYVNNAQNQKEFSKDWETISKDYKTD